ncbi:hypothetical protein BH20VER1_BH20VER1_07730 [soil metagenome]
MSRIVIAPDVCNGQPTIRGTRISARTVLEFLAAGDSIEDVLAEYPSLTREDVLACIALSSELMGHRFSVQSVA